MTIKSIFEKLSIKRKLFTVFISFIVYFFLLVSLFNLSQQRADKEREIKEKVTSILKYYSEVKKQYRNFLLADLTDPAFYNLGRSRYSLQFEELCSVIPKMQPKGKEIKSDSVKLLLKDFFEQFDLYAQSFAELKKLILLRGSSNHGMLMELKQDMNKLEEALPANMKTADYEKFRQLTNNLISFSDYSLLPAVKTKLDIFLKKSNLFLNDSLTGNINQTALFLRGKIINLIDIDIKIGQISRIQDINRELVNPILKKDITLSPLFNLKSSEKSGFIENMIFKEYEIDELIPQLYRTIEKQIENVQNNWRLIILIINFICTFLQIVIIFGVYKSISNPLASLLGYLKEIVTGKIPPRLETKSRDEYSHMTMYLNDLMNQLELKTNFANQIGIGNFEFDYQTSSNEDKLGIALVTMKNNLLNAKEEAKKAKAEEEKRTWSNQGVALFGDILRQNNENLPELSFQVIKHLIHYMNAKLGGIFVYNDDNQRDIHLELMSSFAYDRRRFMQKKIMLGEGIIGSCAQEKKTVYMSDLPEGFMEVTSGLGHANPGVLLVVPMIIEENLFGIIEIGSLEKFEKHQIDFVQKVAENIAATMRNVRVSEKTKILLDQTREHAEAMKAQEEEMRQNLEELQTTQEEMHRKQDQFEVLESKYEEAKLEITFLKERIESMKT